LITNESSGPQKNISALDQQKTFLYKFSDDDKKFAFDDLDIILYSRLAKMRNENKFDYLFRCYEQLEAQIVAKQKNMADMIE
jgi:hypothetical protein